jgi:hypothetical protein
MKETITLSGKIGFEPEDYTRKQKNQSSWKKVAMVFIDGDVCEYYSWFLQRRYNIILNKPLRLAHVSFINDSMKDLTQNGLISEEQALINWEGCKQRWDGKEIPIVLELSPRTNDEHWWMNIPQDERELLHSIRAEIGLGRPHFGLHMSIGRVRDGIVHQEHSKYIHDCIKNGFIYQ